MYDAHRFAVIVGSAPKKINRPRRFATFPGGNSYGRIFPGMMTGGPTGEFPAGLVSLSCGETPSV